jgi:hypothetical protein
VLFRSFIILMVFSYVQLRVFRERE